jgi:hypothetical protein
MDSSESVSTTEPFPNLVPPLPTGNESALNPPENATPVETSRFEKLKSVTSGVFESAGTLFKRGGGRPRKDGKPNKLDIPLANPKTNLPLGAAAAPPLPGSSLDSTLVRRCCTAVLKAFSGVLDGILFHKAKAAGYSAVETQNLVSQCAITEKESDAFAELAEICLRKYGVGTEYCPEIGLGCIVLGVSARYLTALKALHKPEEKTEGEILSFPNGKTTKTE